MKKMTYNRKTAVRIGTAVSALMILAGIAGISDYIVQWNKARQTTRELREAADGNPETQNAGMTAVQITVTPVVTAAPAVTPAAGEGNTLQGKENLLPQVDYPNGLQVNERIRKARKKSGYIMGWLTMDDLDEPVMQKDNRYFLDHDATGLHNANGAIFMDENVKMLTRPYTFFLYGHNMKSGAMFGNLRKYRNAEYCQAHRTVSYETMYDKGKYEIFAVTMVRVTPGLSGYVNIWNLDSANRRVRQEAIAQLRKNSLYYSTLKVGEADQLLLLITCEGEDDQRLVVAAKRIEQPAK